MKDGNNCSTRKVVFYLIICTILILVSIGVSFFLFNKTNAKQDKSIDMGTIYLQYVSDDNTYTLENAVPIKEIDAKKLNREGDYFDFSVTCEVSKEINYEIAIIKDNKSNISDEFLNFYLEKQDNGTFLKVFEDKKYKPLKRKSDLGSPKGAMVLSRVKCGNNRTNNYRLRMWLDEKSPVVSTDQFYKVKIKVYNHAL